MQGGGDMREILFRGKSIETGKWVYGVYSEIDGRGFIIRMNRYIPDTRDWDMADYYEKNPCFNSDYIEVEPETVGQFIGLTDTKGKKIFEGDIVSIYSNIDKKECLGHVEFSERGFWAFVPVNSEDFFYHVDGTPDTFDPSLDLYYLVYNSKEYDNAKVISNIHDNPALIKE